MKKVLILILAVILSLSVFAMAACQQPCETHVDGNHDGICDVCEEAGLSVTHTDSNHDGKCDGCGAATKFEHVDAAHDGKCDVCNQDVEVIHVDADGDGYCDVTACGHKYEWVDALADAKAYVDGLYLNGDEITAVDFEITTIVSIGGVKYNVAWEIQSTVAGQTAVALGEIDSTTKQQKVNVDEFSGAEVAYKLVATVSDAEGHSVKVEYARKVPQFVVSSYEEYLAHCKAADGVSFTIRAYVIGAVSVTSSSKGSLYLQDADGNGYYAYAPSLPADVTASEEALDAYFPFGTEVCVTGTGTVYGGQYEFNKGCQIVKTGNVATAEQLPFENVTEAWGSAKNQGDHDVLMQYQNKLVVLEEAIFTKADDKYYYFTVNGVQYNIYKTNYFMADQADIDALFAKFEVGKAATIKGIVSCYSNLYQIYPLDVECISNVHVPELSDAQKVAFELGNLQLEETITENCSIELPSAGGTYETVAITWALKETYNCATIADGKLNVTLPSEATTITVVATLTLNGATDTKEFVVKVESSKIDWKVTADALAICNTLENGATTPDYYYFYGTVGEIYNTEYCNFYLLDEQGNSIVVYGLYAPNGTDRYGSKRQIAEIPFKEGDLICMRAQVQKYYKSSDGSITPELVNAVHIETPEKGTEIFVAYNATEAIAIANALENGATTEEYAYFVGTVGEIYNTQYCNFYLTDANGGSIVVYGLYAPNGTDRYGSNREIAEIPFKEGDTVVLRSKVQKYYKSSDGSITPELVSAILVSITSNGVVVPPVEGPLSEGQAYYLTVNQETVGKTLHFTGKSANQAWYLATTQNTAEAVEVFVEVVDGNYRIYFMDGESKTYIRMYERSAGSGSIELTTTVPSETYSYDETYKTLVLVSGSNKYYMGMYGTYETISCSKYSYITSAGNFASVFTPVEGGPVVPPVEEHECESVCPTCGKCLDEDCAEAVCAEKCEGHTPAVVLEDVAVNVTELEAGQLAANTELVAGSGIYATTPSKDDGSKLVIDSSKKSIDGFDFTLRLKFGGTMKVADGVVTDGLKLEVKGAATITVYAMSSSSGSDRVLQLATLADDAFTTVGEQTALGASIAKLTYEVSAAGTYYLGSTNSGINVYYIAIAYQAPAEEPAVVINGTNYSEAQAEEALLALKAGDVVVINTNGTIAKEYTFVAANYTIGEGAELAINANAVAPAGAKLAVSAGSRIVVGAGATIDLSALTQADFSTSTEARLVIAADAKVIMPAYTEQLWNDAYLKVVIEAMVADSEVGAQLVLGETTLTKTASGWEAEAPAFDGVTTIADALNAEDGVAVQLTGRVTEYYNGYKSNFYIQDEDGNSILVYYSTADANIGDIVTVVGTLGSYNGTKQIQKGSTFTVVEAHVCSTYTDATCLEAAQCTICGKANGEALGHTEANAEGKCDRCGAALNASGKVATFTFGANSTAAHVDGNDLGTSKTYTDGAYSLVLTGMSKVYGPAYDAKGNSAIKLGTSSKTGELSFTVPDDVTSVVIYVAQYKANTTKITVNGTAYTISTASNNGEYTAITVDTTTTKTVTFATVSGGVRCMIDAIEYIAE